MGVWPPSKDDRSKVGKLWNVVDRLLSNRPAPFEQFENDSIYDEISGKHLPFVPIATSSTPIAMSSTSASRSIETVMSSPTSHERCLDAERRRRASLLPPNAICEACGEDDPLLLETNVAMVLCADDAAIDRRQERSQRHHLASRLWSIVLDLTKLAPHRDCAATS